MLKDKGQLEYQALLSELQLVDNLLETHANIMTVLISGMLFFLFQVKSEVGMLLFSILVFL